MPAPTTQTSALVFLSNVDDRMIEEEVATQTEGVLRRLDRRFRTVLFLEGRLDVFFVMIGNRLRQSANQGASSENVGPPVMCAHLAAGAASKFGQTAKARSGYMCSHSLRDATASVDVILNKYPPRKVVKSARRGRWRFISTVDQVLEDRSLVSDGTREQVPRPDGRNGIKVLPESRPVAQCSTEV